MSGNIATGGDPPQLFVRPPNRAFGRPSLLLLHRLAIHLIVAADVCFSSRLYRAVLPEVAQRIILSTLLAVSLFYLFVAVLRGHLVAVGLFVFALFLIVGQGFIFEYNWGMDLNITGIAQYIVVLSFIAFFVIDRDGLTNYAVMVVAKYAFVYLALYLFFVGAYLVGLLPLRIVEPLVSVDAERGGRFFAYSGALAYAWFLALRWVRECLTFSRLVLLFVCLAANFITLSRVYLLCLLALTALSIVRAPRWVTRAICLASLAIVSSVLLYGIVLDERWNPFFAFASGDTSGFGRALEYQVSQGLLAQSPIFGSGLPSAPEYLPLLTGISFYSPGDLGVVGPLLDFGIIGLICFAVSSVIACSYFRTLSPSFGDALFLTGCTLSAYGCIAPIIFAPGGAFYFALILGIWLSQRRPAIDMSDVMGSSDRAPHSHARLQGSLRGLSASGTDYGR